MSIIDKIKEFFSSFSVSDYVEEQGGASTIKDFYGFKITYDGGKISIYEDIDSNLQNIISEKDLVDAAIEDYRSYVSDKYGNVSDYDFERVGYKDLTKYLLGNIDDISEYDIDPNVVGRDYYMCKRCGWVVTPEVAKSNDYKCPRCGGQLVERHVTPPEGHDDILNFGLFGYHIDFSILKMSEIYKSLSDLYGDISSDIDTALKEITSFNWTKAVLENIHKITEKFLDVIMVDPIYLTCCFIDNFLAIHGKGKDIKKSLDFLVTILEYLALKVGRKRLSLQIDIGIDVKSLLYKLVYKLLAMVYLSILKSTLLMWLRHAYDKLLSTLYNMRESENIFERTASRCIQWQDFLAYVYSLLLDIINGIFGFIERFRLNIFLDLLKFADKISADLKSLLEINVLKHYTNIIDRLLRFGYFLEICLSIDDIVIENTNVNTPYNNWRNNYAKRKSKGGLKNYKDFPVNITDTVIDGAILPDEIRRAYTKKIIWYDESRVDTIDLNNVGLNDIDIDVIFLTIDDILKMKEREEWEDEI